MFQRLDRMRKHSFGSMIVFGENNNNCIGGLWMWRGHDLAFTVCFFYLSLFLVVCCIGFSKLLPVIGLTLDPLTL